MVQTSTVQCFLQRVNKGYKGYMFFTYTNMLTCLIIVGMARHGSEWERPPRASSIRSAFSHSITHTHTFPFGMKLLQPVRGANGLHTYFTNAQMAATNLLRLSYLSFWILSAVSTSRIYPPNEGRSL